MDTQAWSQATGRDVAALNGLTPMDHQHFLEVVKPIIAVITKAVPQLRPETLAAQMAVETWYGATMVENHYNLAGISSRGRVIQFPNFEAFEKKYAETIHLPYYTAVLTAPTLEAQMTALGQSPWSAAHYAAPGTAAGSSLIDVWTQDLEPIWDAVFVAPIPNPPENQTTDQAAPQPSAQAEGGNSALIQDTLGGGITPNTDAPTVQAEDADAALFQELRIIPDVLQVATAKTETQCMYAGLAALHDVGAANHQVAWYLEQCYGFNTVFAEAFAQSVLSTGGVFGFPLPTVPAEGWDFAQATPNVAIPAING